MRILLLILLATTQLLGQGTPIKISYDSDLKDYEILNGKLDRYKVFIDGEYHNVSSNEIRQLNLFKYLYFNYGVRYYIKEYDFDIGFYVNKYIKTGDKSWLKFWIASKEAEEFYDQLYQFNTSLPADKKIQFASIDAYSFQNTDKFITDLVIDKGESPIEVNNAIQILKTIKRTNSRRFGMDIKGKDKGKILESLNRVRKLVRENNKLFVDYFGEDYLYFHLMVFNLASEDRIDKNLAANFLEFTRLEGKGNYYLVYGLMHARLNSDWLAGLVNMTTEFNSKVCSFTSQYRDSEYWLYEVKSLTDFGIITSEGYNKNIIDKLVNETTEDCTLFPTMYIGQGIEKTADYIYFLRHQKAMTSNYKKKD